MTDVVKIQDIKDDIEMVIASAMLIDYKVEHYRDPDHNENGYYEHFYYFQKDGNYCFTINYRTKGDEVENFSISSKINNKYLPTKTTSKDFVTLNSPTRKEIVNSLPELLKRLSKVK